MPAIEEIISELTGKAQTVSQPDNFVLRKQSFTLISTLQSINERLRDNVDQIICRRILMLPAKCARKAP